MLKYALLATLLSALPLHAQVVINELMAENLTSSNVDEDGQNNDWLELQNNGATTVSLNGWYLTDDAGDLQQWRFPVTSPVVSLAPGARLVVWCSGKNRKAAVNRLHANFKLDAGGEFLALVRADGVTIEHSFNPYPPQFPNSVYGYGLSTTTQIAFAEGGPGKAKVAANATDYANNFNTPAHFWSKPEYDDTTWHAGNSGFGFGAAVAGLIGANGDITTLMQPPGGPNSPACFLRFAFEISDINTIQSIRVRVKHDDAFAYYLNGNFMGKSGFAPASPTWNSTTVGNLNRPDTNTASFDNAAAIPGSGPLVVGTNILGILVMNENATNTHLLCRPQLELDVTGGSTAGYLATSTRGGVNSTLTTAIGPYIRGTVTQPARPVGGGASAPLVISTKVEQTLRPLAASAPVVLKYRIMYGTETSITMLDDGAGAGGASGDLIPGDSVYTCKVPTTVLTAGQMIRWRIEAKDNGASATYSYDPPYPFNATSPPANPPSVNFAADLDQYFGTVALDGITTSNLPILHLFAQTFANAEKAPTDPAPVVESCSAFFRPLPMDNPPPGYVQPPAQFYDNIPMNRHGQSSGGFAQRSHNASFNKENRFNRKDGEPAMQGINLLSTYADKSKIRHALAWDTWNKSGHVASHFAMPVRVELNAAFRGIYDVVEDANRSFLERVGLDPERGSLYKVYNSLENGAVASGNASGSEKKNPDDNDYSELVTFTAGINNTRTMTDRLRFAHDNVDIASTINMLATHAIILSRDFGHKNYYMYRDTAGTQEWAPLPWDQDLSFGHTWTGGNSYWDDDIHSQGPLRHGTGNHLFSIVYGTNELNAMFVARIRTLMNTFYVSALETNGPFEQKINALINAIDPNPNNPSGGADDADLNARRWGFWFDGSGTLIPHTDAAMVHHTVRAHATRILTTNNTVATGGPYPGENPYGNFGDGSSSLPAFLPGRRQFLYNMNPLSGSLPIPASIPAVPPLIIESIVFNPTSGVPAVIAADLDTQSFEYFVIRNPNAYAVDLSGWKLSGEIDMIFRAGTVIPAQGTATTQAANSSYVNQIIVANKPQGFRQRTASPTFNEYRHVTGPYKGQLSARGGSIILSRPNNPLNPGAGYTQIATNSYAAAPTGGQQFLRITELNYHPANPVSSETSALPGVVDDDFEFIEITNTGVSSMNLSGARFERGVEFTFPVAAVSTIAPGQRRLVVANLAAFQMRYGTGLDSIILGEWEGNLANGGEEIQLLDNVGEVVLEFTYSDDWYPPTDGGGRSLVTRVEATAHTAFGNPAAWAISGDVTGSPGADDTSYGAHYAGWRWDHYTEAELALPATLGVLTGDDDSDGNNNFTEYCFGKSPRVADNNGPLATAVIVNASGVDYPGITFIRRKDALDVTYHVESSASDLLGWTSDMVLVNATDLGDGTEQATYRHSTVLDTGRSFRVRAVKP